MRKIKFRAYSYLHSTFYSWDHIRYVQDLLKELFNNNTFDRGKIILQQWTGELDTEKIEIYESDVVNIKKDGEYHEGVVRFINGGFIVNTDNGKIHKFCKTNNNKITIISHEIRDKNGTIDRKYFL